MAKVVLIKNLADYEPSITSIVMSTMLNNTNISKYDEDKIYNMGDKVYVIENGNIIIKECIGDNVSAMDDQSWITVESGLLGNGSNQNPNSTQSISNIENKIITEISNLSNRVHSIISLDDNELSNSHILPLYDKSDVLLTSGKIEFGRIYI